jgi:hypothetical protein
MTASTGVSRPRVSLAALTSLVLVTSLLATFPAFATSEEGGTGGEHCPGANEGNAPPSGDYEVVAKYDGNHNAIVPDAGAHICVKAGPHATGIFVADGTTSLHAYVEAAGIRVGNDNVPDVSYYIVYAPAQPTVDGEVTVVKAWDLDNAFAWMSEADVSADLEVRIDGEYAGTFASGHTFTGLEMGTLVEVIGESNVVLPDGCWFENELAGAAWTVTDTAPIGTITLTNVVTCEAEAALGEVTVVKAWDLDNAFAWMSEADVSADLEVRIDGEYAGTFASGHTFTGLEMGTLVEVIGESNVVLPDGCWFENELAGAAWTVTDTAPIGTITLTNVVTCEAEAALGEVTVVKAWDLDNAFAWMSEADVSADLEVRIDGEYAGTFASGHTFTGLEMGTLVEVIGESNVVLPDGCWFENELAGAAWTVTDTAPIGTITLTNVVTCEAEAALGEVTVVKAWDLDNAFAWMSEADVSADLEVRIDGEYAGTFASGHTFTGLEMGTLVEVIGESNVVLPDGCWFENELAGAAWTVTDTAPIGTITLTNELTCVLDTIIVQPGDLTVTKEAIDGFVLDDDGDKIVELDADGEVEVVYRFTITNVGEGPIHLTSFDDTTFGDLLPELEGDTTLAGGESIELDMAVWLTADDFVDGLHHNVVTVTGVDDEDLELIAEAEEFIWLVDVEDVVVARPIVDDDVQRVVVADRVLTQVAAQQPAPVLPRTGASLLALLLAGAFALTAGSAMTIIPRRRKR